MGYALYTYHWRANSIRKGGKGPYDDRLGPVSTLRHFACHAIFLKLDVLDTPLRRPSGFALFNYAPQPRTHLSHSVRHCQLHSSFHGRKLTFVVTLNHASKSCLRATSASTLLESPRHA